MDLLGLQAWHHSWRNMWANWPTTLCNMLLDEALHYRTQWAFKVFCDWKCVFSFVELLSSSLKSHIREHLFRFLHICLISCWSLQAHPYSILQLRRLSDKFGQPEQTPCFLSSTPAFKHFSYVCGCCGQYISFNNKIFLVPPAHHSKLVAVYCNIPLSATCNAHILSHVAFEMCQLARVTSWQILSLSPRRSRRSSMKPRRLNRHKPFNKIKNIESQMYNEPNEAELAALMIAQK